MYLHNYVVCIALALASCRELRSQPCISDSDCDDGMLCMNGACLEPESQCTQDADCNSRDICVEGTCVVAGVCQADEHCDAGQFCDEGVCRVLSCRVDLCPDGFICGPDDECVPSPCVSDVECAPPLVCNIEAGYCADPSEIPEPEVCDGVDNDLNGEIDEGYGVGDACEVGLGECRTEGFVTCFEDGTSDCDAEQPAPQPELCNGLDDDCDGSTDEDFPVDEGCVAGDGECAAGVYNCTPSGDVECTALMGPSEEICDQLDNDCDGIVDDGFIEGDGGCVYGQGACAVPGWQECTGDGTGSVCVPSVEPQPSPIDEICDGLDNDCNGVVDDGIMC